MVNNRVHKSTKVSVQNLRGLNRLFGQWVYLFLKNARTVIFLTLVVFLVFGFFFNSLTQIVSIEDQLDPDMTSTLELKRLNDLFGAESSLGFIFEPKGPYFQVSDLCLLQTGMNNTIFSHGRVEGFTSPFKLRRAADSDGSLSYLRVLPSFCEEAGAEGNPLRNLLGTPWKSVLTDTQARDVMYSIRLNRLEKPGRFGTFDPQAVEDLIAGIKQNIPMQPWITGSSAQQYFVMKGMEQSQALNILVVIVIWLSFRLLFGTWRSGAIFLFSLIFTATIVFGLAGMMGYGVDPLSSCLFMMIAVSSIEDFIFVSYYRLNNSGGYFNSFFKLIVPSFFTSLTTMMGFASLVISDLQSIRRFGILAALGALTEWIFIFLIVPCFMKVFPSWRGWVNKEKSRFYEFSLSVVKKKPPLWLVRVSLLVFVGAYFSIQNFRLSQTPSEIFPVDHIFQQSIEYIKKSRGWVANVSLVFESHVTDAEKVKIVNELSQDPLVSRLESYAQAFDYVSSNVKSAKTKELVSFEMSYTDLMKRYKTKAGEERVLFYLKTTNTAEINRFREKVKLRCDKNCWLAGEFVGFADFSTALIKTLFDSLFLSLILVGLIIYYLVWVQKKKVFIPVIVSALWGPAWMLVLIYAFDLSVNFITCIVASTLVGLTGDNAIQYLLGGDDLSEGIEKRGVGSVQCALIMAACCLTFVGSYFEPPRTLGLLLASGFLLSLFGDLWVLKALLSKKK